MTTASIPARQGGGAYGQAPVPQGDMNGGYASAAPQGGYANQNMAANSYPSSGGYGGGVQPSTARSASASPVQRSELSAPPAVASRDPSTRNEAMAQPFPSAQPKAAPSLAAPARQAAAPAADNLTTATVRSDKNGWHTDGASSVTLRPGESIATLSNRYGVPEKELLRVNGLKSASAAQAGQSILIPKFGQVRNAAKDAAGDIALNRNGDQPTPLRAPDGNVAVLPSQAAARDKD